MKRSLLLFLFIVLAVAANAQVPAFQWANTIGASGVNEGRSITTDASGNVYTTGSFEGTADFDPGPGVHNLTAGSGSDFFISKTDPNGNLIWAKNVGANNSGGFAIATDAGGNVYVTGGYTGTADFDPGAGTYNMHAVSNCTFILKLNSAGNFVWARQIGSANSNLAQGLSVDAAGNVYATGYFTGASDFDPGFGTYTMTSVGPGGDIFILKLDAAGNFAWAKQMSGAQEGAGLCIKTDNAGNVYSGGVFRGTVDFDPGAGTANLTTADFDYDGYVSKLDANGNFIWVQQTGGNYVQEVTAITFDASGNFFVTGFFADEVDFDPGAGLHIVFSYGPADGFICKFDNTGNFLWVKTFRGITKAASSCITTDATGNVYVAGNFSNTADFDPDPAGTGTYTLTSNGSNDIFICKLDPNGNFLWAQSMGGTGADEALGIAADASGGVYTAGFFSGMVDFDPAAATTHNASTSAISGIFIHKLKQEPDGINENTDASNISMYPNPVTDHLTIVIKQPTKNTLVEIYNVTGKQVYNQSIADEISSIDLSGYTKGLYFIRIIDNKKVIATKRIVKQ